MVCGEIGQGDYRFVAPLDAMLGLRDAIDDLIVSYPDLFPLTHTRRVR